MRLWSMELNMIFRYRTLPIVILSQVFASVAILAKPKIITMFVLDVSMFVRSCYMNSLWFLVSVKMNLWLNMVCMAHSALDKVSRNFFLAFKMAEMVRFWWGRDVWPPLPVYQHTHFLVCQHSLGTTYSLLSGCLSSHSNMFWLNKKASSWPWCGFMVLIAEILFA